MLELVEKNKYSRGKNPRSRNGFKKNRVVTEEQKIQSSERNKRLGIKPPSRAGSKASEETRLKMSNSHKGKIVTKETREKISQEHTGKKFTEKRKESYANYWESKKGKKPWNYGLRSDKTFQPYPPEFNNKLKKLIRDRDNNQCLICKNKKRASVHHINYDKKDCRPENLITLCNSCHMKTNTHREYWEFFFKHGTSKTYKLSLAFLVDLLSIVTLKSVILGCNNKEKKEAYEKEAKEIMNDIHYIMIEDKNKVINWGKFIRAIQINFMANYSIWINETKARQGGKEQNHLLPFTHSVNGLRMKAGNAIIAQTGGRKDLNLDRLNDEICLERGFDFSGILE